MVTSLRAHAAIDEFYEELISDHFEEIEWLLEHRDSLFRDGDLPWREVADYEQRLWPKLEVLLAHGERGLAFAAEAAAGVVEETARAGVFVLAHRPEGLALLAEINEFDTSEQDVESAYLIAHWFRGLEAGHADAVENLLLQKATSPNEQVRREVARLIGYRRLQNRTLLQRLLGDSDLEVQAHATLAAAKLGLAAVLEFAERGQTIAEQRDNRHVADLFALAQFLLGGTAPITRARQQRQAGQPLSRLQWALLAMAGDPADFDLLVQHDAPQGAADRLRLLGVHGDARALPVLQAALADDDETLAIAAAEALHWLTGAGLFAERWIAVPDNHIVALNRDLFPPDPTDLTWLDDDAAFENDEDEDEEDNDEDDGNDDGDEDTADEDEDDDWDDAADWDDDAEEEPIEVEAGLGQRDHDDADFDANDGFSKNAVCTDSARWHTWLAQHGNRFQPGRRYRRGLPFSANALVDEICDDQSPFDVRRRALWELAHGRQASTGLLFEPDWWLAQQQPFVDWLQQWRQAR